MKILAIITAIFCLTSANALAETRVDFQDGRVQYSRECLSNYAFSHFDGRRLERPCVADSDSVTLQDFLLTSRHTDCQGRVRVVSGVIHDGVLSADSIEAVWGCGRR